MPTEEQIEQLLSYATQHGSMGTTTRRPGVPEAWYVGHAHMCDTVLGILSDDTDESAED